MNGINEIKRVLHIFGSLDMGGAETRTIDIYKNIDRNKVQFDFISLDSSENQTYENEILELGGKIFKLESPRKIGNIKHYKVLKRIMISNKYLAVHSHTSFHNGLVMMCAFFSKIKIRISHSRTTNTKKKGIKNKIFLYIGKFLVKTFATNMLAISKESAIFLYGKKRVEKNKVEVLPNPIDLSKFLYEDKSKTVKIKEDLRIENCDLIIGQIGRFEDIKNQKFLVDIASVMVSNFPLMKIIFIGDGPKKTEVEEKVKMLKLEDYFIFLGNRRDINEVIKIFDILVVPSLYEGLSGVLIEAQAANILCVASSTIPKEVDFGLGLIKFVDLNSSINNWKEAIISQLKIPKKNDKQIIESFEKRNFTIEYTIKRLMEIYKIQ